MRSTRRSPVSLSSSYLTFEPFAISMKARKPSSTGSGIGMSCHGWVMELPYSSVRIGSIGRIGRRIANVGTRIGYVGDGCTRVGSRRERIDVDDQVQVVIGAGVVL